MFPDYLSVSYDCGIMDLCFVHTYFLVSSLSTGGIDDGNINVLKQEFIISAWGPERETAANLIYFS